MKVQLRITKNGKAVFTSAYDVVDADSFGKACADAWFRIRQQQMEKESSIGALMEHLDHNVLNQLIGAHLRIDKA
jgi:hypothetical protein